MSDASEHALLNASGAPQWGGCAASLRLNFDAPRRSSKYADEGSAAHILGSWTLTHDKDPSDYPHKVIPYGGVDWPVTKEMVESIRRYVEVVKEYQGDGTLLVEQKVAYGKYLFGNHQISYAYPEGNSFKRETVDAVDLAWGTSDAVILRGETLCIVDLKYGANPNNKVDAIENEQLMLYALGALYEYELIEDIEDVVMVICQPRLDHVSEYTVAVNDLHIFAEAMKTRALFALEALGAENVEAQEGGRYVYFTPGDKQCRWCDAKYDCPALKAEVAHETRDLFAGLVIDAQVPEDRLAKAMASVGMIEAYCTAIRAECERRLLAGQPVPGFKLVEGRRGNRAWTDPDAVEEMFKKTFRLKVEEMYDFRLISPTTAEKVLKKNPTRWKRAENLISRADGKPSVAPDSDKRPALTLGSVDSTFAALAEPVPKEQLLAAPVEDMESA